MKSERVVYDQVKHRIHFTDATLDLFGVPILYTPVLSEPDPTVKYASGLLAPDFGNSTKIGYFARLPCYFALSPTNDLTVAPQFSTQGGELLEGEYRARWNNSGMWLQGSVAYNPDGGLGGGTGRAGLSIICSAPAASRSKRTMLAHRLRRRSSPTMPPICASTTFPISTGW